MSHQVNRRDLLKLLGVSAGAVAAAPLLSACSPGTKAPAATSSGAIKDDGKKTFAITSWAYNEANTKQPLQAEIDKYTGANAGTKISTPSFPYNDYLNQLLLEVRGGTVTGAVQLDVAWLATLAATGKLIDLSSVATGVDYTPAALNLGKATGKQFALPWTQAGIGLLANQEILNKAGVTTPPATIDDFEATLKAIKGLGGITPYAAMTKPDQLKDIIPWMWTFGAKLVEDGKITIGDEASVAAVTWYKKIYDLKYSAPDVNRVDARALFSQGKAAFYEDAISGKSTVVGPSPDKDLASKILPVARPVLKSGDKPQHMAWGQVIGVINGDAAFAAANFAKAITSSTDYSTDYFTKTGLPPTTTAGLAATQVTNDKYTTDFSSAISANSYPDPFWVYPQFSQMETILAQAVQGILIGKSSVADGLKSAAGQMSALMS
jgi:multiple sugar transport system substrate-binding protein